MSTVRAEIRLAGSEPVIVRLLKTDEDLHGLLAFRTAISSETQKNFAPHNYCEKTIRAYIDRNGQGKDLIYLAWAKEKVIAYFFLWEYDEPVPVLGIGIQDDFQGKGLGVKLMDILIEDARSAGKEGIQLTVMKDNARAIHLYEKMGFRHSGDVENLQEGGKVLIVPEMFLPLKEGAEPIKRKHAPPVL